MSGINNRLAILLILFLTVIVYANSLKNEFVWDDYIVIVDNDFIKSSRNFPSIFSNTYLTKISDLKNLGERYIGSGETTYRPVVTASYFIDYAVWKLNPLGFHFSNLAIHIFNALLLYVLLNIIAGDRKIALIASLFFALHTVNTEAVDVISFRDDLLACLFFIFSFLLFINSEGKKGQKKTLAYIASVISFSFALFSKEMAVTLPFVLMLYDYFFVCRKKIKDVLCRFKSRYSGYILAILFYFGVRVFLMGSIDKPPVVLAMRNVHTRILTMTKVIFTYIQWMLFPINIHPTLPDDPSLISRSLFEPGVLISILIISALLVTAIKIRKKFGLFSFGVLWFFITLIPVSNIPLLLTNYMAARYLYIPGIGFYLLLATCIVQLPNIKFPSVSPIFLRKVSRTTIVILLAFYSLFTVIRNMVWKNNVVFRLEMVEKYPNNALAHSSLGDAFRRKGLLDKAIYEYKIALRLDPNYAEDHDALGVCYYKKGMLNEAIEEFKRAIQLDRLFVTAYANLGSALGDKGFYQESMVCFEKAIEIDSNFINAYDGLGITYARMKKYDEARKVWERAREIGPYNKKLQEDLEKLKSLGY